MNIISLHFEKEIDGKMDEVWEIVRDIYVYPSYMPSVLSVDKYESDGKAYSKWEISARGHILNWTSEDKFSDTAMRYVFEQVEGDFAHLKGCFQVSMIDCVKSSLSFEIEFDIGIPVLANTLHPILRDVLLENLEEIASSVQKRISQWSVS